MTRSREFRLMLIVAALAVVLFSWTGASFASSNLGDKAEVEVTEEMKGEAPHGHESAKLVDLGKRFLNFGILAIALIFILRKPLKTFFGDRTRQIKSEFDDLESRKTEARKQFEEIQQKLKDIEKEREVIIARFVKEGEAEKQKIVENAQKMSKRIEEQAKLTINQEVKKAKENLQTEIADMATQMAEDMIKQNMKPEDQKRLISEYVEKVVEAS